MKFIHTADLHLDSPLRGLDRYEGAPVEKIRGATRAAFARLIELAINEHVGFLLIAGDVYDGDWRDYNTGLHFALQMEKLRAHAIKVFIVSGNHDALSQMSKQLKLPDNVHAFSTRAPETVRLDQFGTVIHGQGFAAREVPENICAQYPAALAGWFNIGLLHTSADGRPGHAVYAPCSVADLRAKGYDYWALGHVHQREVLHENPWIVFSGNLQGRHVRESGPRGCSLVTVENGKVLAVEHCEIDVLRWAQCRLDVSECDDGEGVVACVRAAIEKEVARAAGRPLAVRIHLSGSCRAHPELCADPDRWENEIRLAASTAGEVWVERVKVQTSQCVAEPLPGHDDPLDGLLRSIRELENEPALLDELMKEIAEFQKRLPAELAELDEPGAFDTAAARHALLQDVQQILLPRLLSSEKDT